MVIPGQNVDQVTQEDLASGLAGKANTAHGHVIGDVTGLSDALSDRVTNAQLTSALAPYLTASLAADTYVPRTGGAYSGNVTIPALFLGAVDGPRLDRSGGTIRARSNNGLADAPFSAGAITASGNINLNSGAVINSGSLGVGTLTINNDGNNRWQFIDGEFTAAGIVRPTTTNARNLGTVSHRWANVFGVNGDFSGNVISGTIETRNGTNPTSVIVQNQWTSDTNRETGFVRWVTDVLQIGNEKGSLGGSARNLELLTDGITRLRFDTDYQIRIGDQGANSPSLFSYAGSNITGPGAGRGLGFFSRAIANSSFCFGFSGDAQTQTTGASVLARFAIGFQPSSGDASYQLLSIGGTINQTGGASGITRGVFVAPTLTAAADWRSYDCSNNTGFAYHSSGTAPSRFGGNVGIGTIPSVRLQVQANDNSTQGVFVRNLNDGASASTDLTLGNFVGQTVSLRNHSSTHSGWANTSLLSSTQSGGLAINTSTTGPIVLYVSNSERARVTTTGFQVVGNIGFANARVEQPLTQSMALRTFESSLSAWQEPWIGRATPTGPVIGFLGASPIGRQTLPAAATDPATTQALCNALRQLLINFGFAN